MNYKFFTGRISRGGYFASLFGVLMVIQLLAGVAANVGFLEIFSFPVEALIFFILALFVILSVKRLHDINTSGLYILIFLGLVISVGFVPVVGYLLSPSMLSLIALLLSLKKGTVGPNKYGEDPVYRKETVSS